MKRLALLMWWFVAVGGAQAGATVVGPFDNEQTCNALRANMTQRFWVSICWHESSTDSPARK